MLPVIGPTASPITFGVPIQTIIVLSSIKEDKASSTGLFLKNLLHSLLKIVHASPFLFF